MTTDEIEMYLTQNMSGAVDIAIDHLRLQESQIEIYELNAEGAKNYITELHGKLRSMEAEMESLNDTLMIRTSDYNNLREIAKRDSARLKAAEELAKMVTGGAAIGGRYEKDLYYKAREFQATGKGK